MALLVQKFGGTSVGDPERIREVADHVARCRRRGDDVVLVVSAMGKETDELLRLAGEVSSRPPGREMDMLITAGERKSIALVAIFFFNDAADSLLEAVGLQEHRGVLAAELPYGRKRALEIATTLALEPDVVLLDEPTAGMDNAGTRQTTELIGRIAKNRTVLMVEHNMSVVSEICDTITVLARGKVIAQGNYGQIADDPLVAEAYLGAGHG